MTVFGRGQASSGCLRCSTCSIHYPAADEHRVCEICGEPTSYFSNVEPDPEWQENVKYAKMHPQPSAKRDPHNHRFERYLAMGFDENDSQKLALAVYGPQSFPLYHGLVKDALDAGCDPQVALDVFT